ncbi:MAG: hypothetical protein ACYCRE_13415, partial [Acidobacteriaceae bacterium]
IESLLGRNPDIKIGGRMEGPIRNECRPRDSHERMILAREMRQDFPLRRFDTPVSTLLQLSVPSTINHQ